MVSQYVDEKNVSNKNQNENKKEEKKMGEGAKAIF